MSIINNIYLKNREIIINELRIIWDYMKLNQKVEKCDLIIGCGCSNMDIPVKCAYLYKEKYAPKIIFAGGLGKITKNTFNKSEAELYRDIAIREGVNPDDIYVETKSTNTSYNFIYSKNIIDSYNIKSDKILIVHRPMYERRTLSAAKRVFKDKHLLITSPDITFDDYIKSIDTRSFDDIYNEISVIIGNIQRIIIYPQFGWHEANEVPKNVINAYYVLKEMGFNKYIYSEKQIKDLIDKNGLVDGYKATYFN